MKESNLHMYDLYERFYSAAENSPAFAQYCTRVYGADFSQDGFSGLDEIHDLIERAGVHAGSTILDLGCGNGGMCEYIHRRTGAAVYGLDYSEAAIRRAQARGIGCFEVGVFGEKDYPPAVFDAVLSVDTFYFVKDKEAFLRQIYGWLKPGGVLAVMYSPFRLFGDSIGSGKTGFAAAASNAGYAWEATEYTDSFYRLMRRKHMTAVELEPVFRREGLDWLYDRLVTESISPGLRFSKFKRNYARYMYIIEKGGSA